MSKKNKKIIRYRKPWNLNIGVIIFLVVFVYMIIVVFRYATKENIHMYEVTEGSIASTSHYTGLILRDETVVSTNGAGYLNYYVREGGRAANGSLVYTLDEDGSIHSLLAENAASGKHLSAEHLERLKGQLSAFSGSYDPMEFDEVYQIKSFINSSLLEFLNADAMEEIAGSNAEESSGYQKGFANVSGIVQYYIDGYETMNALQVDMNDFDQKLYERNALLPGKLVESGSAAYKIITSDEWDILFPIQETDLLRLQNQRIVSVHFKGSDLNLNAEFEIVMGTDGKAYGKLHLYKYMVQFSADRYVDFSLNVSGTTGLKIPVSSVVNKAFYLIPKEYLTKGNNGVEDGFMKEIYGPSGTSSEFCSPTIYYEKDGFYYVDTTAFTAGEYLILPDSTERYQVGMTASLQGVYNINKGYAVFKQIDILESNEDYHIVKKNMPYGLSVYDHIILNGNVASENDIIYE